jgi:hypothetical protein
MNDDRQKWFQTDDGSHVQIILYFMTHSNLSELEKMIDSVSFGKPMRREIEAGNVVVFIEVRLKFS